MAKYDRRPILAPVSWACPPDNNPSRSKQGDSPLADTNKTLSACIESNPYVASYPKCTSLQFMFAWATSSGIMLLPPEQRIRQPFLRSLVHFCFLSFGCTWPVVSFLSHLQSVCGSTKVSPFLHTKLQNGSTDVINQPHHCPDEQDTFPLRLTHYLCV